VPEYKTNENVSSEYRHADVVLTVSVCVFLEGQQTESSNSK